MMRMTASGGREGGQKKKKNSGVLDRSNMARSHSYFSFTLLCICARIQRFPSPKEAFQRTAVCQFFKPVTPFFGVSVCARTKGLLLVLPRLLLSSFPVLREHVRRCRSPPTIHTHTHAHYRNASLSDHTVRRQTFLFFFVRGRCFCFILFLIPAIFDSSEYWCSIFY